eukprot:76219_1
MFSRIIKCSRYNMVYLASRALTGSKLPSGTFFRLGGDGPEKVSSNDLFANKKVVLFSFVGAYTGTCLNQVPSFQHKAAEFKKLGVDAIYGTSANDVFVLKAFKEDTKAKDIEFLQDFNCAFSESIGKIIDGSGIGLGTRTGRYSAYIDNGDVKQFFEEPNAGLLTVADGDTLCDAMGGKKK